MAKKTTLDWVVLVLMVIGGLQLGLIGIAGIDVLGMLGGWITRIVYILIGLAALYTLYLNVKK
jgi:uncharacterized membrane protein YuzA (DUF378 family)